MPDEPPPPDDAEALVAVLIFERESHSAIVSLGGIGGGGGFGGARGGAGGGDSGHCHVSSETQSCPRGRHCAKVLPGRWKQPKGRFPGIPGAQQLSLSRSPLKRWYLKQLPKFSVQISGAGALGGSPGPGGGDGGGDGGGGGI